MDQKMSKVVIIGGGFGGLRVARKLKKAQVQVTLIDKTNHHLFQPLLYQVATAGLSPEDVARPIREILRLQSNTSVIMGEVVAIQLQKNSVMLSTGQEYFYDYLILAVGGSHSYFGHDEWEKDAPGLKTLLDAVLIRNKILMAFEHAERSECLEKAQEYLRFIVIGGGPTGVELAGAIAEIAKMTMLKNFRHIKPEQAEVFLIEGTSQVLPTYPKKLGERAKHDLESLGVKVLTNTLVTNIHHHGVDIGEKFLPAGTILWAAGNQASPLLKTLGTPLDRQGRAIVEKDLSLKGHPNVFVIGDASSFPKDLGGPLPGTAPVAIQQGNYVANIIRKEILPEKRKPFRYFDKGQMATIGRARAVAMVGKLKMTGFLAWLAWSFIHIIYLINFRNRMRVMSEWIYWYFTGHRNARLIIPEIEED
jgi:NADH dehydrogenase